MTPQPRSRIAAQGSDRRSIVPGLLHNLAHQAISSARATQDRLSFDMQKNEHHWVTAITRKHARAVFELLETALRVIIDHDTQIFTF